MLIKEFIDFLQKHYTPGGLLITDSPPADFPAKRTIGLYGKRGRFCVDESFPKGEGWYTRHERAFRLEGSAVYDVLKDPANRAALNAGGFPDYAVLFTDHGPFGQIPVGFIALVDGKWTAHIGDTFVFYLTQPFGGADAAATHFTALMTTDDSIAKIVAGVAEGYRYM